MRAVVQRVKRASVSVGGEVAGAIDRGLVVLLGVGHEDGEADADYLAEKIVNLRIFEDSGGKLNLSCREVGGGILAVSQFTLYGDCRKGRRPSFSTAAGPEKAEALYEYFLQKLRSFDVSVASGRFHEEMLVEIHNHGPVTLLLDSRRVF